MAQGTILTRETADGAASYSIKYRDAAGRQVKRAVGRSRRQAEKALREALIAVDKGAMVRDGRMTFAAYAGTWLEQHRPTVEHSTAVDYANTLENHLIPFFGARRLAKITVQDILDYRAKKAEGTARVRDQPPGRGGRIKRKLAPKTINNQITLLALILGHASADGLIGQNPASSREAKRPLKLQVPHRERDYLRPHEVPAYLDACSDFWRPRAMTLLLTGCRIGELIALRWDDVDWLSSAIIIARAYKPLEGEAGSTKGDETGRRVDIGPQLLDELANHRTRAEESSLGWDEDLIFAGPNGGHDDAQRLLRYEHRPALKRAGLRTSLVAHELRHTAAAIWLSLGYPMEYVRRQMGHRQISTTINSYGHLERTMIPDAAARAESAVLRPAGDTLR